MKADAQSWLPAGAISDDWVRARLQPVLGAWSAHWFAARTFRVARMSERSALNPNEGWTRRAGQTSAIRCSSAAVFRLAETALGLHHGFDATDRDRRLLEQVAEVMIDDLRVRLEAAFGGVDAPETGGWLEMSVAEGVGPDSLLLALPRQALVEAYRESLSAPPSRPSLPALKAGLSDLYVTLEATVGSLTVSMPDLAALEPGDVLVLPTRLEDPIGVSLLGSPQAFARARLADHDGELALAFHPAS